MTHDRPTELLHLEADGRLTEAERAELAELAAADRGIATERMEMRALVRLLEAVPEAEPPLDLGRSVMHALPPRSSAPAPATGLSALIRQALSRRPVLVYAGGAAVLLALAFFGGDFMRPVTQVDSGDRLTGSLTPRPWVDEPGSDTARLEGAGLDGTIRLVRTPGALAVEADLTSEHVVELVLTFDDQAFSVGEVTAPGVVMPGPGRVSLRGAGPGECAFRVALRQVGGNGHATVNFQVLDSGTSLQEGRLVSSGDGEPPPPPDAGR